MNKEDQKEIERLIKLKQADMRDKQSCLNLVNKYTGAKMACCLTCDAPIRLMFNRLKEWWSIHKEEFNEPIIEPKRFDNKIIKKEKKKKQ